MGRGEKVVKNWQMLNLGNPEVENSEKLEVKQNKLSQILTGKSVFVGKSSTYMDENCSKI